MPGRTANNQKLLLREDPTIPVAVPWKLKVLLSSRGLHQEDEPVRALLRACACWDILAYVDTYSIEFPG